MTDPRVQAIRADKKVGYGSCCYVDECYTDAELIAMLDKAGMATPAAALRFIHQQVGIYEEVAADIRATAW